MHKDPERYKIIKRCKDRSMDWSILTNLYLYNMAVVWQCIFSFNLCCALQQKEDYNKIILISVYCNMYQVLESVFKLSVWLHKGPSIFNFRLVFFFFLTGTLISVWDLDSWLFFYTRWVLESTQYPALIIFSFLFSMLKKKHNVHVRIFKQYYSVHTFMENQ